MPQNMVRVQLQQHLAVCLPSSNQPHPRQLQQVEQAQQEEQPHQQEEREQQQELPRPRNVAP